MLRKLFYSSALCFLCFSLSAQNWLPIHTTANTQSLFDIYLCSYQGKLLAAGALASFDSLPGQKVAAWDGTSWLPVDSSFHIEFPLSPMTVFRNELYMQAQTATGKYLLRLDSNFTWHEVPNSLIQDGTIYASAVYQDKLYVGGGFQQVGNVATNNIARWDGNVWEPLGTGTTGVIECMEVYNGELYVGGSFTKAGGLPGSQSLAKWNGQTWSTVGSNLAQGDVLITMAVYRDRLYLGGGFSQMGNVPVTQLTSWNGALFDTVGNGISSSVSALGVFMDKLYAGFFSGSGETGKVWNGSTWENMPPDLYPFTRSFAYHDCHLYAAGNYPFHGAPGLVMVLDEYDCIHLSSEENSAQTLDVYPNPTPDEIYIRPSHEPEGLVSLELYDYTGKRILHVPNIDLSKTIDLAPFPAGVYFLKVAGKSGTSTTKIIKQ